MTEVSGEVNVEARPEAKVTASPSEVTAQQTPQLQEATTQPSQRELLVRKVKSVINRLTGKGPTSTESAGVKAVDSAGNPLQPDLTESPFTQEVRKGTAPGLDKGTGGLYPIGTIDIVDQDRARLAQLQLKEMGVEARKKLAGEEQTTTTIETPATVSTEVTQPATTPAVTEQVPEGTAEPSPAPTDAGVAKALDTPVEGEHEEVEEFLETKPRPPLEPAPPVQTEAVTPPPPVTPIPTVTGAQIPVETPQPQTKTTVPVEGAPIPVDLPPRPVQTPTPVGVAEPVGKQSI